MASHTSFLFFWLLLCLGTDTKANCVHSDANLIKQLNTLCASLGGSSSNCPAGNATAEGDWSYRLYKDTQTYLYELVLHCTYMSYLLTYVMLMDDYKCIDNILSHQSHSFYLRTQAKSGYLYEQPIERVDLASHLPQHIDRQRNYGVARNYRCADLPLVEHLGRIPGKFETLLTISSLYTSGLAVAHNLLCRHHPY